MEFLKEALGEELFNQFSEKIKGNDSIKLVNLKDGGYVSKEKFDSMITERDELRTQLKGVNGKLDTLNTQLSGQETLQNSVSALQNEIQAKENEIQRISQEFQDKERNYRIESELRRYKAKDPSDIMPKLKLDELKEENGNFVGLDEQINALKETKGYLFEDEAPQKGGTHMEGEKLPPKTMNEIIRGVR